jgi:hypothetical protein
VRSSSIGSGPDGPSVRPSVRPSLGLQTDWSDKPSFTFGMWRARNEHRHTGAESREEAASSLSTPLIHMHIYAEWERQCSMRLVIDFKEERTGHCSDLFYFYM